MAEKPKFAKSDVKSGVDNETYASKTLGGVPPKKSVEQIDQENTPKKASGSIRR